MRELADAARGRGPNVRVPMVQASVDDVRLHCRVVGRPERGDLRRDDDVCVLAVRQSEEISQSQQIQPSRKLTKPLPPHVLLQSCRGGAPDVQLAVEERDEDHVDGEAFQEGLHDFGLERARERPRHVTGRISNVGPRVRRRRLELGVVVQRLGQGVDGVAESRREEDAQSRALGQSETGPVPGFIPRVALEHVEDAAHNVVGDVPGQPRRDSADAFGG
mmetsp:Transcript_31287/g.105289  ORF Transcript_31287/g.105289 Transcript_31287/m.105289 type:complete len:219 (+) Transcript_31287:554-1210(+)